MHVIDHTAYATYVCQNEKTETDKAIVIRLGHEGSVQNIQLTSREMEILELIVQEYSSKQIAAQLYISTHTVISHRRNMKEKLGVKSVVGLVMWWCEGRTINRH